MEVHGTTSSNEAKSAPVNATLPVFILLAGFGFSHTIMLDFDHITAKQLIQTVHRWRIVWTYFWLSFGRLKLRNLVVSKTSHGWHIEITVANLLPNLLLPFIQLCLRSHRAREILNLNRILDPALQDGHPWDLLYQRKYAFTPDGLKQTGEEKPQPRLTEQVTRIVKGFSRRSKRRLKR